MPYVSICFTLLLLLSTYLAYGLSRSSDWTAVVAANASLADPTLPAEPQWHRQRCVWSGVAAGVVGGGGENAAAASCKHSSLDLHATCTQLAVDLQS